MKFVVDGVVFQSAERGIGDVWQAVLPLLVDRHQFGIVLLDRGGAPAIPGVVLWPFPSYDWTSTAADSALLETTCRLHCADLFASTSSTTPLRTPSLCQCTT